MEHFYLDSSKFSDENWFGGGEPLYKYLVDRMRDGSVFVEVGSWKGRSICYMAVEVINSGKNIKCYSVDTWRGSPEHQSCKEIIDDTLYDLFLQNIEPVKSVVTPIRKPSVEAANEFSNGSLDCVFIDANHSYEEVKNDIMAWLPKVKKGGIICGHDYGGWHEVTRAVDEMFPYGLRTDLGTCCWMFYI